MVERHPCKYVRLDICRWCGRRALLILFLAMSLVGCRSLGPTEPPAPPKIATRGKLLTDLADNMRTLRTLKAKASVLAIRQDIVRSVQKGGKPYRKEFGRVELNGRLLLQWKPPASRQICFSGDAIVASADFRLLGKNDDFWLTLPNENRDRDKDEPPGFVYKGQADRKIVRPSEFWSVRPQDIWDLFLHHEVFDPNLICYMETWDEYYVLVFIRQDWPQHICSKIWIGREDLEVEIHQIFDGAGELVAEGRFGQYKPFLSKADGRTVSLPTRISLLWPRDYLVMRIEVVGGRVNETIDEKGFQEYIPPGYEVVPVDDIIAPRDVR